MTFLASIQTNAKHNSGRLACAAPVRGSAGAPETGAEKGKLGGWKITPFYNPKVSFLWYGNVMFFHSTALKNG